MEKNSNFDYPEIDLSLVTFNSARWIDDFFSSLRTQSYPLNKIHVFIRDNGSTDETIPSLERAHLCHPDFASFQIELGSNVGFGQGHNVNLGKGRSSFYLVSNLDLTFEADAIAGIVSRALSDEISVASWEFRQKPYEHPKYYNPITMQTTWSSSACILFRREAIVQVGGYEPRIFMYGEDVELSYRLRSAGYVLKYHPSAVCWHYTYGAIAEVKPLQFIGSKLGNAYIRLRYGNLWQIAEICPLFMALLFLPQRFSGQRKAVLKAIVQLLRNAPYFLAKRKASSAKFPFNYFDYERSRPGAFYENNPLPPVLPLVSVIIRTTQGRQSCLKEAVSSVLNQTYPNIELIVVEEGSITCGDFMQEISARNVLSSVSYFNIESGGRGKAGNVALTVVAGEFMCFLGDDDLFFADHIEVLVQALLVRKEASGAYGAAWQVATRVISAIGYKYANIRYNLIGNETVNCASPPHKQMLSIQSVLFVKSLYDECGGFNEHMENLEDEELLLRYTASHEFVSVSKLTSLHRVSDSSKAPSPL
ncbi:MAG: glycosyltransferase [Gallionella sp.]|nr:glycosyltransferase [Gallionella sp.]